MADVDHILHEHVHELVSARMYRKLLTFVRTSRENACIHIAN